MNTLQYQRTKAKSNKFLDISPLHCWRERRGLTVAGLVDLLANMVGSDCEHNLRQAIESLENGVMSPVALDQVFCWAVEGLSPGLLDRQTQWHLKKQNTVQACPQTKIGVTPAHRSKSLCSPVVATQT